MPMEIAPNGVCRISLHTEYTMRMLDLLDEKWEHVIWNKICK